MIDLSKLDVSLDHIINEYPRAMRFSTGSPVHNELLALDEGYGVIEVIPKQERLDTHDLHFIMSEELSVIIEVEKYL